MMNKLFLLSIITSTLKVTNSALLPQCTSHCLITGSFQSTNNEVKGSECEHDCTCTVGKCDLSKCKYNCKDYSGAGTDMSRCTNNCKCYGGGCRMNNCQNTFDSVMNCVCFGNKCSISDDSIGGRRVPIENSSRSRTKYKIMVGRLKSGGLGRIFKL